MDSLTYIVPLVPVVLVLGFLYPHACCAFLIAGATPYFAITEWLGVPWSTELTATAYATTSAAAITGLIAKNTEVLSRLRQNVPVLALMYMGLWIWRRVADPPILPGFDPAPYLMLGYGLLAFVTGLFMADEACWRRVLDWAAIFGLMTTVILLYHWAIGTTNYSTDPTDLAGDRWLPVRNLTGIIISLELGVGSLSLRHALGRRQHRRRLSWLHWAILPVNLALITKLGERGPLLFLVLAVGLDAYLGNRGASMRRIFLAAMALAVVALGLYVSTELAPSRATDVQNYELASNTDRTSLYSTAYIAFSERPFWGWGGSLVGRTINGGEWWYVHAAYLDPLIDTGLAGALLCWAMLASLAGGMRRHWVRIGVMGGAAASALPLYLLVALEAQVSGTIWSARHLWLLTGVLAQLIPRQVRRSQVLSARIEPWHARQVDT